MRLSFYSDLQAFNNHQRLRKFCISYLTESSLCLGKEHAYLPQPGLPTFAPWFSLLMHILLKTAHKPFGHEVPLSLLLLRTYHAVQMACQSAQVPCAQTNELCPHAADPMNNLCLQVFVLKLKSFTSTATVFQAGIWSKVKQDTMEFLAWKIEAKRLRKDCRNMSPDILGFSTYIKYVNDLQHLIVTVANTTLYFDLEMVVEALHVIV